MAGYDPNTHQFYNRDEARERLRLVSYDIETDSLTATGDIELPPLSTGTGGTIDGITYNTNGDGTLTSYTTNVDGTLRAFDIETSGTHQFRHSPAVSEPLTASIGQVHVGLEPTYEEASVDLRDIISEIKGRINVLTVDNSEQCQVAIKELTLFVRKLEDRVVYLSADTEEPTPPVEEKEFAMLSYCVGEDSLSTLTTKCSEIHGTKLGSWNCDKCKFNLAPREHRNERKIKCSSPKMIREQVILNWGYRTEKVPSKDIDTVPIAYDHRTQISMRGQMIHCYYCECTIRVDEDLNNKWDYCYTSELEHCEDCTSQAQRNLT